MRIGELASATRTTTKTLRFYEEQGLLATPERSPSGYREFPDDAVRRVEFVHRGKAAGLSLAQIRQILDIHDGGEAPCDHVRSLLDLRIAELDEHIRQLAGLRDTIAELRRRAVPTAGCDPSEVCSYL